MYPKDRAVALPTVKISPFPLTQSKQILSRNPPIPTRTQINTSVLWFASSITPLGLIVSSASVLTVYCAFVFMLAGER